MYSDYTARKTESQSVYFQTDDTTKVLVSQVGETGARSYRGRLLQRHFMQNYYIGGEIADSSSILIHQGNY